MSTTTIPPPLRAAARSVYRDLWRASTTTFSGTSNLSHLSYIVTHAPSYHDVAGDPPMLLGVTRFSGWYLDFYLCSCIAFRQKMRKDARNQRAIDDEEAFRNNLNLGRDIATFLRKNIVQAERLQKVPGEDTEAYSTRKWPFFRVVL